MSILSLFIILVLIGVGLYLLNTLVPMDSKVKMVINVVAIVLVLLWLVDVFGLAGSLGTVGHVRTR